MINPQWTKVANEGDVDEDDVICVTLDGKKLALFFVNNTYYATDNLCTHEVAELSEGYVDGATIECPLHQGVFCLKTGEALAAPAEKPIRTYPVKTEGGGILVQM